VESAEKGKGEDRNGDESGIWVGVSSLTASRATFRSFVTDQISAAFISYCRDDQEFALRLAQDLKAAGAAVWLDQLDIKPGSSWDNAVEDALLGAHQMLVVLTPASVRSENVRDEISYALKQGKTVIPVLYMECIIPLRLERKQHIDFRADYARGLEKLLRELHVDHPNQAVLERAAEGDAKRQLAWQAREVEAERLRLEEQTQSDVRVAREETLRREREAEAGQLEALKLEQEKVEVDRLAQEAKARRQRELEEQQAREQAQRVAQHQVPPPQPGHEESKSAGSTTAKAPARFQGKTRWMILGGIAAILIAGVVILYLHANRPLIEKYADYCAKGDAKGCSFLGDEYISGPVGMRDYGKAFIAFTKACDGNYDFGCNGLGVLYINGSGVAQDFGKGMSLFAKSCDGGSALGCSNLASQYHDKLFDYERALDIAQRAVKIEASPGYVLNLAEANLTTAHFDTCLDLVSNIRDGTEFASETTARDVIKMACQWGSQKWDDSLATANLLSKETAGVKEGEYSVAGDVNFLKASPAFKSGRGAWIELFTSLQAGDSAGMTAALQKLESLVR
jgi:TPR repeat protein